MRLVTDYSSPAMQQYLVNLFDTYLAPLGHTRSIITSHQSIRPAA